MMSGASLAGALRALADRVEWRSAARGGEPSGVASGTASAPVPGGDAGDRVVGDKAELDFQELAFSQEGEDILLDRFLNGQALGFYVDIGCHHPTRFSNTERFYQRGWRGINVDANREAMRLFDRNRPRDINLWSAVGERDGVADYYVMNDGALNTLDSARLKLLQENTPYHLVETLEMPVRTLASILDEYAAELAVIDFMSVDVEGWDLKVLQSNDWARYQPLWLVVEDHAAARDENFSSPMRSYIEEKGYVLRCVLFNSLLFGRRER